MSSWAGRLTFGLLVFSLGTIPACKCGGVPQGSAVLVREGSALRDNVRIVAAYDGNVYYAEGEHGSAWRLRRVSTAGGTTSQLAEARRAIIAIVPSDDAVYFAYQGAVARAPKTAAAATVLVESAEVCGSSVGCSLAVSRTHVFVTTKSSILRISKALGPASEVVTGFSEPEETPLAIAVDATHLYWVHYLKDGIYRMPLSGGEVQVVTADSFEIPHNVGAASPGAGPRDRTLLVEGGFVYFLAGGKLGRVPVSGGKPETLASTGSRSSAYAGGFQVVGDSLYFTRSADYIGVGSKKLPGPKRKEGEGGVMKVPIQGGTPQWLVRGVDQVYSLAADSDGVYFATDGGQIVRHPL